MSTYLLELPIPSHWDQKPFTIRGKATRENFDRALRVASRHAEELGVGASRAAYLLDYDGRPTVLKIAHNVNPQNRIEVKALFKTPAIRRSPVVIPGIDYDRTSSSPVWIQTEYASPITTERFEQLVTLDPRSLAGLVGLVRIRLNEGAVTRPITPAKIAQMASVYRGEPYASMDPANSTILAMVDLQARVPRIDFEDCKSIRNWGLYQGRPVIIDAGLLIVPPNWG